MVSESERPLLQEIEWAFSRRRASRQFGNGQFELLAVPTVFDRPQQFDIQRGDGIGRGPGRNRVAVQNLRRGERNVEEIGRLVLQGKEKVLIDFDEVIVSRPCQSMCYPHLVPEDDGAAA